jgi:hypothetical protein
MRSGFDQSGSFVGVQAVAALFFAGQSDKERSISDYIET